MTDTNTPLEILPPHVYPKWIKLSMLLLGGLFLYTFFLIPNLFKVLGKGKDSIPLFKQANDLYAAEKFGEAIPLFEKSIAWNPEFPRHKLALCYLRQGDQQSLHKALGILYDLKGDSTQMSQIASLLPLHHAKYLSKRNVRDTTVVSQPTYFFHFKLSENSDSPIYERIEKDSKDFQKLLNTYKYN